MTHAAFGRTLFLHIGYPKTGTSSIQQFLEANRARLASRGLAYPKEVGPKQLRPMQAYARLHDLDQRSRAALASRLDDPEAFAQDIETQVQGAVEHHADCCRFVFSSELLADLDDEGIRRIRRLFSPHFETIRVIVYLRRQDRQALSAYLQAFKGGYEHKPEHAKPFLRRGRGYQEVLEAWEREFGAEHVNVRIYERERLPEGDVIRDFMALVGERDLGEYCFERGSWNKTYGIKQIALARILNPHFNRLSEDYSRPQALHNPYVNKFLRSIDGGPRFRPARAEAMVFYESFREENEWLRQRYSPGRDSFFDERFDSYPEVGTTDEITHEELQEAFIQLFRYHVQKQSQGSGRHAPQSAKHVLKQSALHTKRRVQRRIRGLLGKSRS